MHLDEDKDEAAQPAGRRTEGTAPRPEPRMPIPFAEFIPLTALLVSLTAMSIDILLPALPRIGATFGIAGANDQQLVVTSYFLGLAGGQLFYGPLSDRFGRKPLLLAGLCIYLAASVAILVVGDFRHLLWARLVQGFGGAASRVLAVAIVRDLFSGRAMARVMSTVMMVFIIVPVFAPSLGQAIAGLGDWHAIFYFLIAIALVDMTWSWLRLPETRGARALTGMAVQQHVPLPYAEALKATLSNRTTVGYAIAAGFLFGCLATYIASAQQIFVGVYQLGARFPVVFGIIASLMAAASFTNTRLVMRYGMRRVSHTALIGFNVVAFALVLAGAGGRPPLVLFGALMAAAFYARGRVALASATNRTARPRHPQRLGRRAVGRRSLTGARDHEFVRRLPRRKVRAISERGPANLKSCHPTFGRRHRCAKRR